MAFVEPGDLGTGVWLNLRLNMSHVTIKQEQKTYADRFLLLFRLGVNPLRLTSGVVLEYATTCLIAALFWSRLSRGRTIRRHRR